MDSLIETITACPYDKLACALPDDTNKKEIISVFEEIINESLAAYIPVEKPFLLNVSGIPGSGKSVYCKMLFQGIADQEPDCSNALYLSFDKIMADQRLPFDSEKDNAPHQAFERWELPARIAGYELLKRAVGKRINIVFEHSSALLIETPGTFVKPHIGLFEYILSKNYDIHYRFIYVGEEVAKQRIQQRAEQTGRIVPEGYIEKRNHILQSLIPDYKDLSTTYKRIEQCELLLL